MKTFHSFLLFALLACVLKGCVAQTCCPTCTSADALQIKPKTYAGKCSQYCYTADNSEYASISVSVTTTSNDNFQVYTVNPANYAIYQSGSNQWQGIAALSTGPSDVDCFTASGTDGVSPQLIVLVYCDNDIYDCELEAICSGSCTSFPTNAPTTAPTTATGTTPTATGITPTTATGTTPTTATGTTPTTATGTTPTTTTPTSATGTNPETTTPHSISSRLGSSISGGLMFLIAIVCAVLSF